MAEQVFATSVLFRVFIGAVDLGSFTTCDGLACEVQYEEHWEGGLNAHPWILAVAPALLEHRADPAADGLDGVARAVAAEPGAPGRARPSARSRRWPPTAAPSPGGAWTGCCRCAGRVRRSPPRRPRPAMETLELAHHGFLVTT